MKTNWIMMAALAGVGLVGCNGSSNTANKVPEGTTVSVALLETTDIHSNVLSYNYYALAEDTSLGLERTSTLIQAARAENPNNVLLDDGDVIQAFGHAPAVGRGLPVPLRGRESAGCGEKQLARTFEVGHQGRALF